MSEPLPLGSGSYPPRIPKLVGNTLEVATPNTDSLKGLNLNLAREVSGEGMESIQSDWVPSLGLLSSLLLQLSRGRHVTHSNAQHRKEQPKP